MTRAGRSVLVTGASSGLGLAASAELAAAGWHVLLGCRSERRGSAAAASIREQVPDASVEVLPLDLASLDSVRAAAELLRSGPPLHGLVCNAGVQVVHGVRYTADGFETTFGTNHLGHFLLIRLLLDRLPRIAIVSSGTHYGPRKSLGFPAPRWADPRALARPDPASLDESPRAGRVRYATSKLANIYTTYELARRLSAESKDLTVNAFDPGLMPETGLARDYSPRQQAILRRLVPILLRLPRTRRVSESAAALARLITDPALAGVTGKYFVGRKPAPSSPDSYNRHRAAELWRASEVLVGLANTETETTPSSR